MKFVTLFSLLVIAASATHAQSPSERLKTKALSFAFNGSSQVGGKIWVSDQDALTIKLGAVASSSKREAADTSDLDEEYTQSVVSLSVGMERHLDVGRDISPYLTGGVSISYDMYTSRSGTTNFSYEYESRNTSLGVHAGVGVEYWLTNRLSLAAQQLITGTYAFGKYASGPVGTPAEDSRTFGLGLGTSSLIFSVYF